MTGQIPTAEHCADLVTKISPGGKNPNHLVGKLLFDIVE